MQAAILEFAATPEHLRHRVSVELFGGGELTDACRFFVEAGAMMPELDRQLRSIELLPLTEECVESPHAEMQREKIRQRAASRAWQSATNRMKQHATFYLSMDEKQLETLEREWRVAKRVAQAQSHPLNILAN